MTSTPPPPPHMQENQVPPTTRMASAHQPYNGHVAESRYSLRSIVAQFIIILVISAVAAIVAYCLACLCTSRIRIASRTGIRQNVQRLVLLFRTDINYPLYNYAVGYPFPKTDKQPSEYSCRSFIGVFLSAYALLCRTYGFRNSILHFFADEYSSYRVVHPRPDGHRTGHCNGCRSVGG